MITTLWTIDPGLDELALVRWTITGATRRPGLGVISEQRAKLHALTGLALVKTPPAWTLAARLAHLATGLREQLAPLADRAVVVIETPVYAGNYAKAAKIQRSRQVSAIGDSMADFNRALGAIILTAAQVVHPDRVVLRPASNLPKDVRHTVVDRALDDAYPAEGGLDFLTTREQQLLRRNPDVRDAVFLGLSLDWPDLPGVSALAAPATPATIDAKAPGRPVEARTGGEQG